MIKKIIVHLMSGLSGSVTEKYATSIARSFQADMIAFDAGAAAAEAAANNRAPRKRRRAVAQDAGPHVGKGARKRNRVADAHVVSARGPTEAASIFGEMARRFDLSVVGQPAPDGRWHQRIIETVLFDSGRPIIVVPNAQRDPLNLDRVMVCWDGSPAVARAVGDAVPFLRRSKSIEVVVVADTDDEVAQVDLGRNLLAWHGLEGKFRRIVAPENEVPEMLLSHAADNAISFIVMGGYGCSGLSQLLLGGASRGMLASTTSPVFMSH